MQVRAFAVALGFGALAGAPCFALTIQASPPRPDVAQHLRSSTPASSVLPAPSEVKDSFLGSGRSQLGHGFRGPESARTTSFSVGPLRGAATVTPGYGASWYDPSPRDSGNPLSLIPPRP
jgi:hypothetical protein